MRYKKIKIGVISLCLMMSAACSTKVTPVKSKLLCPTENRCNQINVSVKTNRDLVIMLNQSLHQTDLCKIENDALKRCIADFNR